jgi:hypothetical protein
MVLPVLHSLLLWYTADAVECHGNVLGKLLSPTRSCRAAAREARNASHRPEVYLPPACGSGETILLALKILIFGRFGDQKNPDLL